MANKAGTKAEKEELKAQQAQAAAEAGARRSKKKKEKVAWKTYVAIVGCGLVVVFGIYLAASNPAGAGSKRQSESRLVNENSFIKDVSSSANGNFTAAASSFFEGWQVDGVKYGLGGISVSSMVGMPGAAQYCEGDDGVEGGAIPSAFNAREAWAECIPEVRDSGNCSSSYAIAAANSLSARYCVADSTKYPALNLSPQQVLSCDTTSRGCKGGGVDSVWAYVERRGLYPEECLPYAGATKTKCKTECDDSKKLKIVRYCVLASTKGIKREIQSRGPVVQPLLLMDDFLTYSGGVYTPTELARPVIGKNGKHMMVAVTVLGWGISGGTPYWIVGNSWGKSWGEEGYARVAMSAQILTSHAVVGHPATEDALAAVEKAKEEEAVKKELSKKERAERDERIKEQQRIRKEQEDAAWAAKGGDDEDIDLDFDTNFEEDIEEEVSLEDGEM